MLGWRKISSAGEGGKKLLQDYRKAEMLLKQRRIFLKVLSTHLQ